MKLSGYILSLLILSLSSSCDTDSNSLTGQTEPKEDIELKTVSHIKTYTGVAALPLPQGTVVGIYASPYNQEPAAADPDHANVRCVCGLSGNLDSSGELKLKEGADYSLYAYAPFKTGTNFRPEAISFQHGQDVLVCTGNPSIRNVSYDNRNVSLNFIHLTAQIRFIVKIGEEGTGTILPTTVFRASGFLPEGRLDLATGNLTALGEPSEQTDVKAASIADEKGIYSLSTEPLCFFTTSGEPQTFQLHVTHEGILYTGQITAVFVPGESSLYTVRIVSQVGLNITATIADWISQYESIDIN